MRLRFNDFTDRIFEESDRLTAWIPVLFGVGIGLYFLLPTEPPRYVTLIVLELILLGMFLYRQSATALMGLSVMLIVTCGFADIQLQAHYQSQNVEIFKQPEQLYLKGKIFKIDVSAKGRKRLWLNQVSDEENERRGAFRITTRTPQSDATSKTEQKQTADTDFAQGQCVEMVATVLPTPLPVMPDTYQFGRKMFFEGLSASGYFNSKIYPTDCPRADTLGEKFSRFIAQIRQRTVQRISKVLPPSEAAVAAALMAGVRDDISQKTAEQYRDSGLAHFLSISGLHMGMIATLAFFMFRLIPLLIPRIAARFNPKKAAAVGAIFISMIYLLISGAQIPTQRAFIMTFVVFLGILFDRRAVSMRMLSLAALIILVISPQALISAGFQMSFAAVTVLIAFYERYADAIGRFLSGRQIRQIILAYIIGLLISDLVASTATLPFAVYHFNKIAVYTTLGNVLAGPIIGLVIMPFILTALLLMPFGLDFLPLRIVGAGIGWVNSVTAFVSNLPYAGFQILSMPLWGLILISFGGLWLCLWQRPWRRLGLILWIIGVFSLFLSPKPDALYSADGKSFAFRDTHDNMIIASEKTDAWTKQIWLEKTLSFHTDVPQNTPTEDFSCNLEKCTLKERIEWYPSGRLVIDGHERDTFKDGGGALYFDGSTIRVRTVCQSVGKRLWTTCDLSPQKN